MLVESGNPAHSLADSQRMREALVVARAARRDRRGDDRDRPPRRLRAAGAVAVREVGGDVLQLRLPAQRLPPAPAAPRAAAAARWPSRRSTPGSCEALGALHARTTSRRCGRLPRTGRAAFADAFFAALGGQARRSGRCAPILLYRTLGPTLPDGAAAAAALWGAAHRCAQENPDVGGAGRASRARASSRASGCSTPSWPARPASCSRSTSPRSAWRRLRTDDGQVHLAIPELLEELDGLATEPPPGGSADVPVRAVGRRAALVHRQHHLPRPGVAEARRRPARCASAPPTPSGWAWPTATWSRVTTKRGSVTAAVEVNDIMQPGPRLAAQRPRARLPRRGRRRLPSPAWRRTSSPPARTATGSPARPGTSTCRPGSSASLRWRSSGHRVCLGSGRAPHPVRRLAVPHRPHHRPHR